MAGTGLQGRRCKGTPFNYCWPNSFPQGLQQQRQSFSLKMVLSMSLLCLADVSGCPWTNTLPGETTSKGFLASCRRRHPCSTLWLKFCKTDNFFHVSWTYMYFQVCLFWCITFCGFISIHGLFYSMPWIGIKQGLATATAHHHNQICHCGKLQMWFLHTAVVSSL